MDISHKEDQQTQEVDQRLKVFERLSLKLEDEYNKFYVSAKVKAFALKNKLYSFEIKRVEPNYYDLSLETRRDILNAPSEYHLCKSIVMENTAFLPEYENKYYQKYYCVIIQYKTQINAEKLTKVMRDLQNEKCEKKIGKKNFHFRLVPSEKSYEMTGYNYNAVTPFCSKTNIPIILSDRITKLDPACFWMGGGDIDLKIRISIEEFFTKCGFDITVGDLVTDLQFRTGQHVLKY